MLHLPTVINFSLSPRTHTCSFYLTSKSWKKVLSHKEYGSAITCCLSSQHWKSNWCIYWTMAAFPTPRTSPSTFCPSSGLFLLPGFPWTSESFLIKRFSSRWKRSNWLEEHLDTYLPAQKNESINDLEKRNKCIKRLWRSLTEKHRLCPPAFPCSVIV